MNWEKSKHTRRFLEIVSSVGDAMDAGSTHTHRNNKRRDDLKEDSAAVAVESSPSSAIRRRDRRRNSPQRRRCRSVWGQGWSNGLCGLWPGRVNVVTLQLELHHSTPPLHYSSEVLRALTCFVSSDEDTFVVDIDKTKLVGHLKGGIKKETP